MIELQVLSKVLQNKSLTLLRQNNIGNEYFISYQDEIDFIQNHYTEYGVVPDPETFLDKFNEFDLLEVSESDKFLIEKLQEQYLYSKMVPLVHTLADKVTEDAQEAVNFLRSNMGKLNNLTAKYNEGYDIIKNADDRKHDYKYRLEVEGLLGITTGLEELDKITHGWLKEDFITIVGRTNEGKTWVMLYFLVAAWKQGKKVLLYSGEMSHNLVGFRFDTLNNHFSNEGLMHGNEKLGEYNSEEYFNYLNNLSNEDTPFVVITPKDIGGKRLDIPTLHTLIEKYKPDIVGIDQLSLMDDYRASKGEQARLRYTHIAEDLYLTSEKYEIPILSPAQANRASKKDNEETGTPSLENISESDGIGQNATRVVSLKKVENTMKISLPKNRYGMNNQEIMLIWDIDKGIVKPFLQVTSDKDGDVIESEDLTGGEELF